MKCCKDWISRWYDPKNFFFSDHPVKVTGKTANHKERVRSWLEYLGRVSLQSLCIGCNSSRGAWEQLSCCSTPPFLPLIFCREVGCVSTMYRKKENRTYIFQLNKILACMYGPSKENSKKTWNIEQFGWKQGVKTILRFFSPLWILHRY